MITDVIFSFQIIFIGVFLFLIEVKCEIGEHGYCTNRDGCNRNEIEENLYNPGRYTAMLIQIQYYAFNDKEKFISYPDILLQFMCRTS